MRTLRLILPLVLLTLLAPAQPPQPPANQDSVEFRAVDLVIDSGAQPLAAYQLSFSSRKQDFKIIGIEGGEHPAFQQPPYYDPKAIQQERAILAAFNTSANLPTGRTRVATIHVQVPGGTTPQYAVELKVAADPSGKSVPAQIHVEPQTRK